MEVRLIDANVLVNNICGECISSEEKCNQTDCLRYEERNRIESAPTIEAEPIKHGQWVLCVDQSGVDNDNNNYAYFCSQCNHQDVHSTNAKVNFCWNCGAKMDEESWFTDSFSQCDGCPDWVGNKCKSHGHGCEEGGSDNG